MSFALNRRNPRNPAEEGINQFQAPRPIRPDAKKIIFMKKIIIKLSVAEIVYDIQNKTYLTGKSRRDGTNHETVAAMQANDDFENANQVLRSVTSAFSLLKTRLSEYLDLVETTVSNEPLEADRQLELALMMPSNYNVSSAETISSMAHAYIVAMAVGDWFTITDKKDAADYYKSAADCLASICEAAHKRVRPTRV